MCILNSHLDIGYGFEHEKVSLVHSIGDKRITYLYFIGVQ